LFEKLVESAGIRLLVWLLLLNKDYPFCAYINDGGRPLFNDLYDGTVAGAFSLIAVGDRDGGDYQNECGSYNCGASLHKFYFKTLIAVASLQSPDKTL
jgi:hypothetical protein